MDNGNISNANHLTPLWVLLSHHNIDLCNKRVISAEFLDSFCSLTKGRG